MSTSEGPLDAAAVYLLSGLATPAWSLESEAMELRQVSLVEVVGLGPSQGSTPDRGLALTKDPYATDRFLVARSRGVDAVSLPSLTRPHVSEWPPADVHSILEAHPSLSLLPTPTLTITLMSFARYIQRVV